MGEINPEHKFWLKGGISIGNISELATAFETMSDETYTHHVNEERNDFANWVKGVMHDEELAGELETAENKNDAMNIVKNRITSAHEEVEKEIDEALPTEEPLPDLSDVPDELPKPETTEPVESPDIDEILDESTEENKTEVKEVDDIIGFEPENKSVKNISKKLNDLKSLRRPFASFAWLEFLLGLIIGALVMVILNTYFFR